MPTKTTEPTLAAPALEPRFLVSRQTAFARAARLHDELVYREHNGNAHPAHASADMSTHELVSQTIGYMRAAAFQLESEYHARATEHARQESRQAALEDLISERVGKAS